MEDREHLSEAYWASKALVELLERVMPFNSLELTEGQEVALKGQVNVWSEGTVCVIERVNRNVLPVYNKEVYLTLKVKDIGDTIYTYGANVVKTDTKGIWIKVDWMHFPKVPHFLVMDEAGVHSAGFSERGVFIKNNKVCLRHKLGHSYRL